MKNRVCEILGIEKPVIQGPMVWLTDAKLAAAVSEAGGLGSLGHNAGQTEVTRDPQETAVLDQPVVQHPDLARLNPDSLNTVKIYTMMIKKECHFVAAELRMGRRGSIIDNIERGGLAAAVNIETGEIIGSG